MSSTSLANPDFDRPSGGASCQSPPCEGTAIYGSGAVFTRATVGGPNAAEGNEIVDAFHAVELENFREAYVNNNLIDDDQSNSGLTGVTGVKVEESLDKWDVEINDNDIRDYRNGVQFLNQLPGELVAELEISSNIIESPNTNFSTHGVRVASVNPVTLMDLLISDNTIDQAFTGVTTTNFRSNAGIVRNGVTLTQPFGPTGIRMENCAFFFVFDNNVLGNGTNNFSWGIRNNEGRGNDLICNTVKNTQEGLGFEANTAFNGLILANRFENFHNGLSLYAGSEIPDQGGNNNPSSNEFHGNPGNADTWVDGSSNTGGTTFWVNDVSNSFFPAINNSATGNFISINPTGGLLLNCPTSAVAPAPVEPIERIAEDSVNYVYEPQASEWREKLKAYRAIERDTTLLDSSAAIKAFDDSLDKATIGRVQEIDEAVESGDIVYADALRGGMSCSYGCESTLKEFFEVYLNSTAIDSHPTPSQFQTLWDIAEECPYKKGEGVYRARVLLRHELDSMIRFDADCSPDSTAPQALKNNEKGGTKKEPEENSASFGDVNFEWRPNPTGARSSLNYDLGGREQAVLRLTDLQGRVLKERRLKNSQGEFDLDLSDLDDGVYLYNVEHDGSSLGSGRLIKTD